MHASRPLLYLVCSLVMLVGSAGGLTQSLVGTVYDPTGSVVPGAQVTILADSRVVASTRSKDTGQFAVQVEPGRYRVCTEKSGFVTFCRKVHVTHKRPVLLSVLLRVSTSKRDVFHRLPPSVLDHRLRLLAGKGAKNCGHVKFAQSPQTATACAMRAFQQHEHFYVIYDLQGIDSDVAGGFVSGTQGMLAALFDSFGTSSEGLPEGSKFTDGPYVVILPCPKANTMHVSSGGRVSCLDRGAQTILFNDGW